MSFSFEIKDEILNIQNTKTCCFNAEISAIINYLAKISYLPKNQVFEITIQNENLKLLERFNYIITNLFYKSLEIFQNKNKFYFIKINDQFLVKNLFEISGILIHKDDTNIITNQDFLINYKDCCKRTYLRIVFLCSGYIVNPEKEYHIEFYNNDYSQALELKEIMNYFNINAKIIERNSYFIIYIKESEQIVDLLNIISAHKSLLKLENIRVIKDVRNNINRMVNCETANLNKTISASVKQIQDITLINETIGIDSLPAPLKEIAKLRLEFPDLSLKEISKRLEPPIGKSGANHRFKKINNIANKLRGNSNAK